MTDTTSNGSGGWVETEAAGLKFRLPPLMRANDADAGAVGLRQFELRDAAINLSAYRRDTPFTGSLGLELLVGAAVEDYRQYGTVDETTLTSSDQRVAVEFSASALGGTTGVVTAVRLVSGDVAIVEVVRPTAIPDEAAVIAGILSSIETVES